MSKARIRLYPTLARRAACLYGALALLLALPAVGAHSQQAQVAYEMSMPSSGLSDLSALPDDPQPGTAAGDLNSDHEHPVTLRGVPADIFKEQAAIWSSPVRIRDHNLAYLVPLGLATTIVITTDHQVMSSSRFNDASLNSHAATASNGLLGGFVVAPVALYGVGYLRHDDHARESGVLAGEAMVDSLVVDEVMKIATMRERPTLDGAKGKFFKSSVGIDSSFPSTHSMIVWSSAAVMASEYPNSLAKISIYGLATGLSVTRVLAKQHFPSDVLVGSAVGWLIGRYVFHRHHKDDDAY